MTEYIDKYDIGKIIRTRTAELDGTILACEFCTEKLPEEFMDKLEKFAGDQEASVTVSGELAKNDYGTKTGVYVSVKVACNNSEECIYGAHDIARDLMTELINDDFEVMDQLLESKLTPKTQIPGPVKKLTPKTKIMPSFKK